MSAIQIKPVHQLVQITAPHFCAGLVMRVNQCVEAAPILRWMVGRSRYTIRGYCKAKGWRVQVVSTWTEPT